MQGGFGRKSEVNNIGDTVAVVVWTSGEPLIVPDARTGSYRCVEVAQ